MDLCVHFTSGWLGRGRASGCVKLLLGGRSAALGQPLLHELVNVLDLAMAADLRLGQVARDSAFSSDGPGLHGLLGVGVALPFGLASFFGRSFSDGFSFAFLLLSLIFFIVCGAVSLAFAGPTIHLLIISISCVQLLLANFGDCVPSISLGVDLGVELVIDFDIRVLCLEIILEEDSVDGGHGGHDGDAGEDGSLHFRLFFSLKL